MDIARLRAITDRIETVRILVLGDFFLDKYLEVDPALEERSLETGLPAHQITGKRCQPGAAGTVCSNLRALEVGTILALGVIGDDGEGYDLRRGLKERRVEIDDLIVSPDRMTPTYTKPMRRMPGGEVEMDRQDIKNRTPLPTGLEDDVVARLELLIPEVDSVIILDQVDDRNLGVVTDRVRNRLAQLAETHAPKVFFADSRSHINEFRNVAIKPNRYEAAKCIDSSVEEDVSTEKAIEAARQLAGRNGRSVFLTLNEEGIAVVNPEDVTQIPGVKVTGPIDIVGAGDSVTAGIVSALSAGASLVEAAAIATVVASVTIQQIGTTGTCPIPKLHEAFKAVAGQFQDI